MADISKITLPSGTTYDIKDATARQDIGSLRELIAGGVSFSIVWSQTDYTSNSTPTSEKLATIPAGVTVAYNSGAATATGTLAASANTKAIFYLIYSKTQAGNKDVYDEIVTVESNNSYFWEKIGDTQIDLTNVVTNVTLNTDTTSVIGKDASFTVTQPTISLSATETAGTGTVSVATGISSITQPTITLTANNSTTTDSLAYVQSIGSATTTKLSATASGGGVSASGDNVTALTGLGNPSTKSVIGTNSTFTVTNPSITLATDSTSASGRVKIATGDSTASSADTDFLKNVSVNNEILFIGAATLNSTYAKASASGGAVSASGDTVSAVTGYASPTTDTVIGTASTFSISSAPTITISSGSTGDVTVATAQGTVTTKYMSASASGTAVTAATTNIAAEATSGNVAWNNQNIKTVLTSTTSISVTKGQQ